MIKAAVLALALLVVAGPASAAIADGLAAPYLHIQVALANDSMDGVTAAATSIAAEAATMGPSAQAIRSSAQAVAEVGDIVAAREAFGRLSDAVVAYGEEVGFGDLKVAYCPMVRKSWVQAAGALRNPFFGSAMLTCGSFR